MWSGPFKLDPAAEIHHSDKKSNPYSIFMAFLPFKLYFSPFSLYKNPSKLNQQSLSPSKLLLAPSKPLL